MKRTKSILTLLAAGLVGLSGCVSKVDQPAMSGPSTFAHSIIMSASSDTLTQNGVDFTDISITSLGPTGQSENLPLRLQTFVGGIAMDLGILSTKSPTTPATIRYTAPSASALLTQSPTTVTIRATPAGGGDARGEVSQTREIDIRLVPQGVIVPSNPNLLADFVITPNPATILENVAFDATASTGAVTFAWNFGDGGTATGSKPFHVYRAVGTYLVTLTVTDVFGAPAQSVQSLVVNPGIPPTVPAFTFSPPSPGIDMTIFFNASNARPANGRTITLYDWDFGDGSKASGMTTTHSYKSAGSFPVTLRVTDDAGSVGQITVSVTVSATAGLPTARITFSPGSPTVNSQVFFDGSTSTPFASNQPIVQYRWDFGDGSPDEVSENSRVTHIFRRSGAYLVRLTVTDSAGKQGTVTQSVTIQ